MKNVILQCDICGAKASQSGKPFTLAGLAAHKKHLHENESSVQENQQGSENAPRPKSRKSAKVRNMLRPDASHVKFCPQCGFNMEVVNAAMAFVKGSH